MPTQRKQALITDIFRKVSKSDLANHTPISQICLCCIVMEHMVLSHIAKHLSGITILMDYQHGFREKLSTVTQLISSCHDCATIIQGRGQVGVIFFSPSKAFYEVPHRRLFAKLSHYVINRPALTWIENFHATESRLFHLMELIQHAAT